MKLRLLMLTIPDFSSFNAIWRDIPSYTQARGGYAGFPNSHDTIKKPLFIKTGSIFPFFPDLHYTFKTIAGKDLTPLISYVKNGSVLPNDTISKAIFPNQKINIIGDNRRAATTIDLRGVAANLTGVVYMPKADYKNNENPIQVRRPGDGQ